jgi:hypothetical protein
LLILLVQLRLRARELGFRLAKLCLRVFEVARGGEPGF